LIAYGRPIDVFFLQIQGSGRLKYKNGRILRAAYAANNGQPYRSIGGVLIRRGELTREQAMRVPLTAMGAIAVDPRYHPYGSLFWLETTLPTRPGDYRGKGTGLLVAAQDTGSAIKGPLRADLFFGSGDKAGDLAGVQKHPVRWTLLLPKHVTVKLTS